VLIPRNILVNRRTLLNSLDILLSQIPTRLSKGTLSNPVILLPLEATLPLLRTHHNRGIQHSPRTLLSKVTPRVSLRILLSRAHRPHRSTRLSIRLSKPTLNKARTLSNRIPLRELILPPPVPTLLKLDILNRVLPRTLLRLQVLPLSTVLLVRFTPAPSTLVQAMANQAGELCPSQAPLSPTCRSSATLPSIQARFTER